MLNLLCRIKYVLKVYALSYGHVFSQIILILYLKFIFNTESKIFQENIILQSLFLMQMQEVGSAKQGISYIPIGFGILPFNTQLENVSVFSISGVSYYYILLLQKGYAIFLFSSKNMIFFICHSFGISISNSIFLSSSSNFPFRSIFKFWVILPRPCSNSTPGESDQT